MDLEIREFKNAIVQFVNKSELPMEVKRLCLKEILDEVNILSDETIKAQIVLRNRKENDFRAAFNMAMRNRVGGH